MIYYYLFSSTIIVAHLIIFHILIKDEKGIE